MFTIVISVLNLIITGIPSILLRMSYKVVVDKKF